MAHVRIITTQTDGCARTLTKLIMDVFQCLNTTKHSVWMQFHWYNSLGRDEAALTDQWRMLELLGPGHAGREVNVAQHRSSQTVCV